jgi:hypothetical protein
MATFTFALTSAVVGSLSIPYEIPDDHLPRIMEALARLYGGTVTEDDGTERPKTERELWRSLTDEIMQRSLEDIQGAIASAAIEEATRAARESVPKIEAIPGEPTVEPAP